MLVRLYIREISMFDRAGFILDINLNPDVRRRPLKFDDLARQIYRCGAIEHRRGVMCCTREYKASCNQCNRSQGGRMLTHLNLSIAWRVIALSLKALGYDWNHVLNGGEAMLLVVLAAAWKQIAYNFLFFLAGLQMIPKSLIEAAAIDGARSVRRFWTVVFPLLTPTTFFLVVVNIVYAFFDTFGIIHQVTEGGPSGATNILVYKVFHDGFVGLDLGGSAAQSVVLMTIVIALTVVQFRYVERQVHY